MFRIKTRIRYRIKIMFFLNFVFLHILLSSSVYMYHSPADHVKILFFRRGKSNRRTMGPSVSHAESKQINKRKLIYLRILTFIVFLALSVRQNCRRGSGKGSNFVELYPSMETINKSTIIPQHRYRWANA